MGAIVQVIFADGPDKALQIGNEEWGRQFVFGTDWNRIRIGIMCAVAPNGTSNITSASLRLGVSTASTDHVGSNVAVAWYGITLDNFNGSLGGGTWTYNAGGGNPFYVNNSGASSLRVLAGVQSWSGNATTPSIPTTGGTTMRRWPVFLELQKSGGNMSVDANAFYSAVASANNQDYTLAQFEAAMNDDRDITANDLPINGVNTQPIVQQSYAFNPALGDPDCVQIGWNKDAFPLNVYAVAVGKYA